MIIVNNLKINHQRSVIIFSLGLLHFLKVWSFLHYDFITKITPFGLTHLKTRHLTCDFGLIDLWLKADNLLLSHCSHGWPIVLYNPWLLTWLLNLIAESFNFSSIQRVRMEFTATLKFVIKSECKIIPVAVLWRFVEII